VIAGTINARCEAAIVVQVQDASGLPVTMDAIIDTGFNGFLTLSASVIQMLGLPLQGSRDALLADGSMISLDIYRAIVNWDGTLRRVQVLAAEGGSLAGMSLLRGYAVLLHVIPGGAVTIQALP
jgi:clan AA aspartic protease